MALDSNGTLLHAPHGEGGEVDKEHAAGSESGGHSTEGGDGHEPAEGEGTDPDEDNSEGPISIVGEGESIVINPANSGGMRYLLVDIYLIRASEKDKTFKGAIDAHSKKLQSLTMDKLSERDIQELSNPSVRKQIENDLKNQYQHILGPNHLIKELVVTRWIMQ
jgi:flagellar basal body-associated protein FliL